MNKSNKVLALAPHGQNESSFHFVRTAVLNALNAVDSARQQCVIAGYLLTETKAALPHGDFEDWVATNIPEISHQTATTWMRAAASVAKALDFGPTIDVESISIPISKLLSAPLDELPEAAHEFRQAWFDFTADKTIKDCINGVTVDGDPGHRVDRAINGKLKGGTRGEDRKAWDKFIASHLSDVTGLLGCNEKDREKRWTHMTPLQRTRIMDAYTLALQKYPAALLEHITQQAKAELKLR